MEPLVLAEILRNALVIAFMRACKVTTGSGKQITLFLVLIGCEGDWVYLRVLALADVHV